MNLTETNKIIMVNLGIIRFSATLLKEVHLKEKYQRVRLIQSSNGRKAVITFYSRTFNKHTCWRLDRVADRISDNDKIEWFFNEITNSLG